MNRAVAIPGLIEPNGHMAARVTRGDLGRAGDVLMLSAEDDAEDTIVPRLIAADADLDRVILADDQTLDRLAGNCNQNQGLRMIIVDPIAAHLPGKVDS